MTIYIVVTVATEPVAGHLATSPQWRIRVRAELLRARIDTDSWYRASFLKIIICRDERKTGPRGGSLTSHVVVTSAAAAPASTHSGLLLNKILYNMCIDDDDSGDKRLSSSSLWSAKICTGRTPGKLIVLDQRTRNHTY
jgi:hypothetical protein